MLKLAGNFDSLNLLSGRNIFFQVLVVQRIRKGIGIKFGHREKALERICYYLSGNLIEKYFTLQSFTAIAFSYNPFSFMEQKCPRYTPCHKLL